MSDIYFSHASGLEKDYDGNVRNHGMVFRKLEAATLAFALAASALPLNAVDTTRRHGPQPHFVRASRHVARLASASLTSSSALSKPANRQAPEILSLEPKLPFPESWRAAEFVVDEEGNPYTAFTRNPDLRVKSASTTKIMTGLLLAEAVERGDHGWKWNTKIKLLPHDKMGEAYSGGSVLGLPADTEMTLQEALTILMVQSANDVAYTIAVLVGGDVQSFITMMNERAAKPDLKLENTGYGDPAGFEHHADKVMKSYTSARDLVTLLRLVVEKHNLKALAEAMRTPHIEFEGYTYYNHNQLLSGYPKFEPKKVHSKHGVPPKHPDGKPIERINAFEGMDVGKTGHLWKLSNLVASAVRKDPRTGQVRRLFAAVLGAPHAGMRDAVMRQSLEAVFKIPRKIIDVPPPLPELPIAMLPPPLFP